MKVRTLKRQHNERTGSHLAAAQAAVARWADCLPGDYYDYDEQGYDDYDDDELNCTHCGGEGWREVDDPLWDECDEFLAPFDPHTIMVDSGDGNRTEEIYGECMKRGNWWPCKGASGRMDYIFRRTSVDLTTGNRKAGADSIDLIMIDTWAVKANLVERMGGQAAAKFWIPFDTSPEDAKQLTSERYNVEKDRWEPRPGHKDNHLFDCEVMLYAAATANGLNERIQATG